MTTWWELREEQIHSAWFSPHLSFPPFHDDISPLPERNHHQASSFPAAAIGPAKRKMEVNKRKKERKTTSILPRRRDHAKKRKSCEQAIDSTLFFSLFSPSLLSFIPSLSPFVRYWRWGLGTKLGFLSTCSSPPGGCNLLFSLFSLFCMHSVVYW